ncbi:MAG: mandelate racemase/muconate lactonizing enzyme family protein [Deltaproteobacteria bacterium]|nr:mandelate racemase/muconate lactonizing enzyme family protein [Deltaproteobacteria bacterium]
MKITAIRATPVNIPLEAPFFWSVGIYPGTSKTIIEVETDEGIVGLGEAPSWDCADVINRHMGPLLIGRDPIDIAGCEMTCVPEWRVVQNTDDASVVKAFGGIEIALWDIRGKAWDKPLYELLGGAVRKAILFTEYFAYRVEKGGCGGEMSAEAVVDYCLKMRDKHGSTMFEGKLSVGDPFLEVATVKLMRARLGDKAMIRLDANMSWSLSTARQILREIEPFNVRNYEDPVATFEEMAQLRRHSAIPFSTHIPDLRRAVALGTPDNIVTNFAVLGGIRRTVRFIGACEAAYLHMVAATEWMHEPSQALLRWQTDDVIEEGPFKPVKNAVVVPEGPGLGVTLAPKAFKRCHERFVNDGPINHFYDPNCPGRMRRLPQN